MSTYVSVVISPATTTRPVVISVSQATRPFGSSRRTASRTASETWSAILSGCPSVTDSEVKENSRAAMVGKSSLERRLLRCRGAAHEVADELVQRVAAEDGADAVGDWQLDPEPVREVAQDGRRRQPLHGHPDLPDGLARLDALRDQLPCPPVPPHRRPARDHEVAHPGEPREGLLLPPCGDRQPRHLGEAAGDERRFGVAAEPEAIGAAGGEADHVLGGGTELDADHVVV